MKKALFLDRDGVINDNKKHVNRPEDLIIYDSAKEGIRKAFQHGYDVFVVTNQGGIEMGYMTEEELSRIHDRLLEEIKPYGEIKEIRYCPDFRKKSKYRKPEPGMILELAEKYRIELAESWMVGDMDTDITAGIRAGCKTAKIGSFNPQADVNGKDLLEVVEAILKKELPG